MRLTYPGLLREKLPSGKYRYRVRVKGKRTERIALNVTPEHPEFHEIYLAARRGIKQNPSKKPSERSEKNSVAWLTHLYLEHLEDMVTKGRNSPATLKQRQHFFRELRGYKLGDGSLFAEMHMDIPRAELVAFRDSMAHTPGKADNIIKAIRAMYKWAGERKITAINPAVGIELIRAPQKGATPWTVEDLEKYRKAHPQGTMAHMAISLFMFTACRISDAVLLSRENEYSDFGVRWIKWLPVKKNSEEVDIPMLPPLYNAARGMTVVGDTYLLTDHGKPFASPNSFRNKFKDWCRAAGLPDRSPHGIRKAAGHLLAHKGASQHEIMAILGHAQAKTSEVYTKGADRRRLAVHAMQKLGDMEW